LGFVAVDLANLDEVLGEGGQGGDTQGEGGGAKCVCKAEVHVSVTESQNTIVLQTGRHLIVSANYFYMEPKD
jgi:hypothetical protein